jgi:hypothetical protein
MEEITKPQEMQPQKAAAYLPLDGERAVAFAERRGGAVSHFVYYFPRLTRDAWEKYFNGIYVAIETDGEGSTRIADVESAGIQMVADNVVNIDGYPRDFLELENWKSLLPYGHSKLVFSQLLAMVDKEAARPFNPRIVDVALTAYWGIQRDAAGKPGTVKYSGLMHMFSAPNAEQKHRYSRAASESRVVGGTRNGKTLRLPRQSLLIDLYDELIVSVDGYSVNGEPLLSPDQIRREMDAQHKVAAVSEVFADSEAVEEGEAA